MADLPTIMGAIGAASAAVDLIDKMADQIERFLTNRPAPTTPPAHQMKIEQEGDALVSSSNGQELKRVTAKELEQIPPANLRHIRVLESSMENHYNIWAAVYPQLANAVDPVAKARTEQQLKGIIRDMKNDLNGIMEFLESTGIYLDDHYMHIRGLVNSA